MEKELVIIIGRNEKLPGQPLIYATSRSFMDYFGINTTDDLPRIREIISSELVEPTGMQNDFLKVAGEEEQELNLETIVSDTGNLIEDVATNAAPIEVAEVGDEEIADELANEEQTEVGDAATELQQQATDDAEEPQA